jgi:hypothetical protein
MDLDFYVRNDTCPFSQIVDEHIPGGKDFRAPTNLPLYLDALSLKSFTLKISQNWFSYSICWEYSVVGNC